MKWSFFFFNDTATTEIYTLSLHDALPISGGEVRLDANPRRGQRHAEAHRSGHGRRLGITGPDLRGRPGHELRVHGDREQAAADHAKVDLAPDRGRLAARALRLVGRHTGGERHGSDPEGGAGAEGVPLAGGRVRPAPIAADSDAGAALRAVPDRHAGPLRRGGGRDGCRQTEPESTPPESSPRQNSY